MRGRGLKLYRMAEGDVVRMSPPMRGRELKHLETHDNTVYLGVAPHAGA